MWSQETSQEIGLWTLAPLKSESPTPFSPQKPLLFSVPVSPFKTQIVIGISYAFCLTVCLASNKPQLYANAVQFTLSFQHNYVSWCGRLITTKPRRFFGKQEQFCQPEDQAYCFGVNLTSTTFLILSLRCLIFSLILYHLSHKISKIRANSEKFYSCG